MRTNFIFIAIISTVLISSCSDKKTETSDKLSELKSKRDSLKTELKELSIKLKSIEGEINEMDPHNNLYIISTVKSEIKNFKHYIKVQGNVNSDQNITMYPEMGGLIKKIYVTEGQNVKKDQILVEFDSEVLSRSKKEVESALRLAKTTYQKQKKLWDKKIGSEIQYLQAKTNYESIKSKNSALDAQLEQMIITAPFSGVIDELFVKEGEMSAPTVPTLRLINLDDVYVESNVSEKYLGKISPGTESIIEFPNLHEDINTVVKITGNFIKPGNRTFRVILNVPNKDHHIKPNQIAIVNLLDIKKEGVVVPSRVILNSPDGKSYLYAVGSDNKSTQVRKLIVEKGPSYKGETIIYNGLDADVLVVDKGSRSIQNGQIVRVQ